MMAGIFLVNIVPMRLFQGVFDLCHNNRNSDHAKQIRGLLSYFDVASRVSNACSMPFDLGFICVQDTITISVLMYSLL